MLFIAAVVRRLNTNTHTHAHILAQIESVHVSNIFACIENVLKLDLTKKNKQKNNYIQIFVG